MRKKRAVGANALQGLEKLCPEQTWQPRSVYYPAPITPGDRGPRTQLLGDSQDPAQVHVKLGCQDLP